MFSRRILSSLASAWTIAASLAQASDELTFVGADEPASLASAFMVNAKDAATHYGDPKGGCMDNEVPFRIQDVPGMICAPKCAFGQCPGDVPKGVTATPTCAMQSQDGNKYCALICDPQASSEEAASTLRGNNVQGGECGAAQCQPIQGTGICTWDDDTIMMME